MVASINTVASIDLIEGNHLLLEVMPNNLKGGILQFYYLNNNTNNISYVGFNEFHMKLKDSIKSNRTFYIIFCGINKNNSSIPDYLYYTFSGNDVNYKNHNDSSKIYLEFNLKKTGNTLEKEITNLFTDNVGVFIQAYL